MTLRNQTHHRSKTLHLYKEVTEQEYNVTTYCKKDLYHICCLVIKFLDGIHHNSCYELNDDCLGIINWYHKVPVHNGLK